MSGPVANTQIDEHPKQGDEYLAEIKTGPAGHYHHESFDPEAIMSIDAFVTQDGNYSVTSYNANGDYTHIVHGGHKHAANSHTHAVTNHQYTGIGQGHAENVGNGHFKQTGATYSHAVSGPQIHASNDTPVVVSPGGNGIQVVKGDQSLMVIEGGIHMSTDKGFSVHAKGSTGVSSSGDWNMTCNDSMGHVTGSNCSFYAGKTWSANVGGTANMVMTTSQILLAIGQANAVMTTSQITLAVGSAKITMTDGSIKITVGSTSIELSDGSLKLASASIAMDRA